VTRLGEGLGTGDVLSPAACARTLAAVRLLARRARALGAMHLWAVGTRAFRAATDGAAFAERLGGAIDARVEVLSGSREAELSFLGAVHGLARAQGPVVSLDIGGASTELVSGVQGRPTAHVSLPVGAVVLTEQFLRHDPPTADEIGALRTALIDDVRKAAPLGAHGAGAGRASVIIGSGGTLVTLAAMAGELDRYRPDIVHGMALPREVITAQIEALARRSVAERQAMRGLDPARAPTILAGALVAEAVVCASGARSIVVSDHGLRHAVLRERTADLLG
jgi:exopolyphosphatase/guanosine-5'-triphosphate,3'-diphosphate pyrophosphatase